MECQQRRSTPFLGQGFKKWECPLSTLSPYADGIKKTERPWKMVKANILDLDTGQRDVPT